MADPIFNPATGNTKEETTIKKEQPRQIISLKLKKSLGFVPKKFPKKTKEEKKYVSKTFFGQTSFGKVLAIKNLGVRDRAKLYKIRNKLEKEKLNNQVQKLKLMIKINNLKKQGKLLPQTILNQQQVVKPLILYPYYSTQMERNDIDSGFNADISHADNSLWGPEKYHDEEYYNENYYGEEFNNDPLMQLSIKIRRGVSPLLW